eukprot:8198419-Alexandrium_andersonii.AAC.1
MPPSQARPPGQTASSTRLGARGKSEHRFPEAGAGGAVAWHLQRSGLQCGGSGVRSSRAAENA